MAIAPIIAELEALKRIWRAITFIGKNLAYRAPPYDEPIAVFIEVISRCVVFFVID